MTTTPQTFKERIIEMKEIDQDLRKQATSGRNPINYLIYAIDFVHGERLKELIDTHGYPSRSQIGEEGMEAFWLIVQHQNYNVALQKRCLENCDFEPKHTALLTDRVLINSGKSQKYGTQLNQPVEDVEKINENRKELGLEPIEVTKKDGEYYPQRS